MVGAVIYVRVSTKEQTENLSLPTQLRACEEYCRRQGYEVVERFHEEGESAKSTDRSQLQKLLTFCRLNKGRVHFVVERARTGGLTNRRGKPLTSQAIGVLLRNQLYAGIVDVPEYGVRGKRGDFDPLISEELFYRVQAILSGRVPSKAPRQRAHPDFPLRGFVRCESCGRGLTGSWSKGRSDYYAYTTAALAAAALTYRRRRSKGCSQTNSHCFSLRRATCGY